jgi:hypothetical protein
LEEGREFSGPGSSRFATAKLVLRESSGVGSLTVIGTVEGEVPNFFLKSREKWETCLNPKL